ncbi:proteinaceous RNase P 1, chloroplastic/mitochondrial-like [Benincasa hispida]|uniref:proteinaceous RNase P 1, chloroplastic/mitochondrial-like n=1 Tax=Benincasa hispida TaxID=102211 RepID=UPI001900EF31|nr:proteinaceous RNase P 1, chloroplastic/mitochondrial-like [Benincasa hispida]
MEPYHIVVNGASNLPQMASSSLISVQHNHFFSSDTLCKFSSTLTTFNSPSLSRVPTFSSPKHTLRLVKVGDGVAGEFSTTKNRKPPNRPSSSVTQKLNKNGSPHLGYGNETLVKKSVEDLVNLEVEERNGKRLEKGKNARNSSGSVNGMKMGTGISFVKTRSDSGSLKLSGGSRDGGKIKEKRKLNQVVEEKEKLLKGNNDIPFRANLDMCSKTGDFMGAIKLYEWAQREGIKLQQYHYAVILYLCSSAALGVIQPAKSGSVNRTSNSLTLSKVGSNENPIILDEQHSSKTSYVSKSESCGRTELSAQNDRSNSDGMIENKDIVHTNGSMVPKAWILDEKSHSNILVNEDIKKYALERGFEIYKKMCTEKIPMNEATLTSVARMAMSMGDGDMAFDMVKQMKPLGLNPRLRSYGPALSAFCKNGELDKAFSVEKHMLEHGVYPEEPELAALLRVSIDASNAEKVYYLLHKLRTSVRQVSSSTADLISTWFKSKDAARVGKVKLDRKRIKKAMENGGGGWHGLGWLGRGKWSVSSTNVGKDGLCKSCGEKLATIDLDPIETENFAESVAAIATQREKNSSFQKFQKWLEYYGPFEAVIDAANVGLFSQRKFTPSKVNLISNGIRQKLPSKKWPLIVLHNRRITGRKMEEPVNKTLIEKWKNADALYATPTGSNDDWYWLYAAIKFKCLIVTNDEMRDHTFQLLGNDFFPRWKERHQVHFSFSATGPVFHMPPPCSVVIQESEKGHWHVPLASEQSYEEDRKWLCITRGNSQSHMIMRQEPPHKVEEPQPLLLSKGNLGARADVEIKKQPSSQVHTRTSQENYKSLKQILSAAVFLNKCNLLLEIEAAEKRGGCTIDFQI